MKLTQIVMNRQGGCEARLGAVAFLKLEKTEVHYASFLYFQKSC